ncbi:MAG: response regulator [Bacteroidia bacterium]
MKTVLVIDDILEMRENIAEILELAGYIVLTAENKGNGIDMALNSKSDLIICHINKPETDGFEVLQKVRTNKKTKKIPFLLVTANPENREKLKDMHLSADSYIVKPFDANELRNIVAEKVKSVVH